MQSCVYSKSKLDFHENMMSSDITDGCSGCDNQYVEQFTIICGFDVQCTDQKDSVEAGFLLENGSEFSVWKTPNVDNESRIRIHRERERERERERGREREEMRVHVFKWVKSACRLASI